MLGGSHRSEAISPGESARAARLCVFAILCLAHLFQACHSSTPAAKTILAEVGGQPLIRGDYENFLSYHISDLSADSLDSRVRSRLLDECIKLKAVILEANRMGIVLTDEETRAGLGEQQRKEALRRRRGKDEGAPDPLVGEIKNSLLANKYYRLVVLPKLQVTQEEVDSYIAQNAGRLGGAAGYYVREIRVPTRDEAEQIHRELTAEHKDFSEVVRSRPDLSGPGRNGLMFYQKGELPDILEQAVSRLKAGGISPVVQSTYGFHILKLERIGSREEDAEARNRLKDEYFASRGRELINQEVDQLVARTSIQVYDSRLGFQYEGAFHKKD